MLYALDNLHVFFSTITNLLDEKLILWGI